MICEKCGNVCKDVSVRDWCVECEWKTAIRANNALEKQAERIRELEDTLANIPEQHRVPIRLCKECRFSVSDPLGLELRCTKGQNPRFMQPKAGDFTSGVWGYQKKCSIFVRG
jgi:hypothetical protein